MLHSFLAGVRILVMADERYSALIDVLSASEHVPEFETREAVPFSEVCVTKDQKWAEIILPCVNGGEIQSMWTGGPSTK